MHEMKLRRTWMEIAEDIASDYNSLSILNLLNLIPPRSWYFKFSFDNIGHHLEISSPDSELTLQEVEEILCGSTISIFDSKWIDFGTNGQSYRANIEKNTRKGDLTP